MAGTQQFCTFFLQGHFFGVPVQQVQEVIRYQQMTRVPLVPEVVRGLINLRGQIVTAVDLRRCLAMPERAAGELPMNLGKAAFEELMKTDKVAEVSAWRLRNRDGGNAHGSSEPFDCRVINYQRPDRLNSKLS